MLKRPFRPGLFGRVRFWHLFLFGYGLALVFLVVLLNREVLAPAVAFRITRAGVSDTPSEQPFWFFRGRNLHEGLDVFAAPLLNDGDSARLWHILSGTMVRSLAVNKQLALVGCSDSTLVSVDLTVPDRPIILDSLDLTGRIQEIVLLDQRAWVGVRRQGHVLVDTSQPDDLRILATYPGNGSIMDAVATQGTVYYADRKNGLGIVDLSVTEPAPRMIATVGQPWKLTVADKRLAMASLTGHVTLYDILASGQLQEVGSVEAYQAEDGGFGHIRSLTFLEDLLVVALADGTLRVLSVSDWPRLHETDRLQLPGQIYAMKPSPDRQQAVVSLTAAGIALIEKTGNNSVTLRKQLRLPWTVTVADFADQTLLLSKFYDEKGLLAFDSTRLPDRGESFAADFVERQFNRFFLWNDRLFGYRRDKSLVLLADQALDAKKVDGPILLVPDGVSIERFEMATNGAVQHRGQITRQDRIKDVIPSDDQIFVLHVDRLDVLSAKEDENLTVMVSLPISGQLQNMQWLRPDYLLVTTVQEGVKLVDMQDRQHPTLLSTIAPPEHLLSYSVARNVLVRGNLVYISQGAGGIYVVDLSRLQAPQLLQVIDTPGVARNMVFYENLLLVADSHAGLFLVDFSRPDKGVAVGSWPTPLPADELALVPEGLFVSEYPAGTMKLPLPMALEIYRVDEQTLKVPCRDAGKKPFYAFFYDPLFHQRVLLPAAQERPVAQKE
jgi:hypothetical protein